MNRSEPAPPLALDRCHGCPHAAEAHAGPTGDAWAMIVVRLPGQPPQVITTPRYEHRDLSELLQRLRTGTEAALMEANSVCRTATPPDQTPPEWHQIGAAVQ